MKREEEGRRGGGGELSREAGRELSFPAPILRALQQLYRGTVKYRRNSQEPTLTTGFGFDG